MDKACYFTRTSKVSRKVMDYEKSGSSSPGTGARSRDLNYDSGSKGDHGGEMQKTRSPVNTRDKHDYDDLNNSSIRVQDPPVSTDSRIKGTMMPTDKTSGNNGGNEDDTRNAFHTSSQHRTTEPLLEDTYDRNNTLRSPDADSYVHGSLKDSSNSKCVDKSMDKTRSYAWEDPREVMENEISASFTPVTDSRSRILNSDSGSSSVRNQLKLDIFKKMQGAKACFTNTDKNEYGTSLQRSSTHGPPNQTHERKTNVFEGDTFEVTRVNSNNVRRNTIPEKSELNDKFSDVQIMESRPKYESKPMSRSSSKCDSIDSLEAHTGCECNDRRKRVKNMNGIYEKCALWIIHMNTCLP